MQKTQVQSERTRKLFDTRKLVFTAMLAAISAVLYMFSFSIPILPTFLTYDFSDVPAVLAALTMGPVSGVFVSLIKALLNLGSSMTGGVGELADFAMSCFLIISAGIIGKKFNTYKGAIIGCIIGSVLMAALSIVTNYFIVYPIYANIMPIEAILQMYKDINPNVDGLLGCILMFNTPFTLVKGLIASAICLPLYKVLRPVFNSYYRK